LNKEYSKEEYEKLKVQIVEDMKKNPYVDELGRVWSYGEFYPIKFNLFGYNESDVMKFFPKTKEEALSMGYMWHEADPNSQYVLYDPSPCTFKRTLGVEPSHIDEPIGVTPESA
jgi:hypothetical protein